MSSIELHKMTKEEFIQSMRRAKMIEEISREFDEDNGFKKSSSNKVSSNIKINVSKSTSITGTKDEGDKMTTQKIENKTPLKANKQKTKIAKKPMTIKNENLKTPSSVSVIERNNLIKSLEISLKSINMGLTLINKSEILETKALNEYRKQLSEISSILKNM